MSSLRAGSRVRLAFALGLALAALPLHAAAPEPLPPAPEAAPQALTARAAIAQALAQDPTLAAAVLEARRAALTVRAEAHRYVLGLEAHLDYSHNEQPSLTSSGVLVGRGDALTGTIGVTQQFPWGTLVAAELTLEGSGSRASAFGTGTPVSLGPGYGVGVRVQLTQPLLRGLGRTSWEAELRSARVASEAAVTSRDEAESGVLRDVLGAYWELWYAQRALAIETQARATAVQRLKEAEARLKAGALAPFDVLPLRSNLAARDEALVAARALAAGRQVTLAGALGLTPTAALELDATAPERALPEPASAPGAADDTTALIARAQARAYTLGQLRAAIAQAGVQLEVASEATRIKLDAGAWLQVQGLGNQRVDDAFAQLGTFGAVSGGVSLALALPVETTALESRADAARLGVTTAREHLRQAEQRLGEEVAARVVERDAAVERGRFAAETARLAAETAKGQAARFASGAGTALEVVLADQARREAELRVVRAAVDAELARLQLAHLTGDLLATASAP